MPRLQDIERFKRDLAALSHEAEVLERWGEKPEVIAPPESAPAAPGQDAADEAAAKPSRRQKPSEPGPEEEEGLPPDFAALLDDIPVDRDRSESAPPSMDDDLAALLGEVGEPGSGPGGEAEAEAEPFDLESFGAQSFEAEPAEAEPAEIAEAEIGEALPDEAEPAEAEIAEAAPVDFAMPEFDEIAEAPAAAEETAEELAPEEEGLGGEALGLGGETLELGSEAAAAPADDFAIPDFDSAPAGGADEDFSIPDLGASLEVAAEGEATPAPEEGLSLGEGDLGADAFETFSFEEPGVGPGAGGFGGPAPGGSGRDLDTEIASLSEEAPVADTFKIDQDWGDFGSLATGAASAAAPRQAPPRPKAAPPRAAEEKFKPVALSEAQVDRLQDSLLSFPLNLRVAVEDILANDRGTVAQQSRLVWNLVDGMPAEEVAIQAGRILKRHIPIPKGREKRTGAALEAQRGTFAYAFVHTFLPIIRIGMLVLAAAAALGYLGWRFVYVPLAADSLYREGYRRIAEDRYDEANIDFDKATAMREYVAWYYRYAEAFAAKRQYILAERKYAALIGAHPKEKRGILAWARLEKDQLKFEEAVEVLKGAPPPKNDEQAKATLGKTGLLSWDYYNQEGLLLLGDVYLDWAEEAPAKYEDARKTYAYLIEHFGDLDIFLERMLLYFIRTDKLVEVLPLKTHFLADPKREAIGAGTLAELGGYLLDKGLLDDVRDLLLTAAKKDPSVPEAHYHLARYFARAGDATQQRTALDMAIKSFAALPGLGGRRAGMYVDSLVWRARLLVRTKEWLGAERDYTAAAAEYEKALELRRVKKDGRFGEAYAGLGDVAYWQRDDLAAALAFYGRAASNGYSSASMSYKEGNILYRMGRYAESLESFFQAEAEGAMSPHLAFAFGSALLARNDLFAAEAYFRKASAAMEKEMALIGEPMPQERPSEIEILRLYMQSENNLGVALYRSAARSGDARRRNLAMAALTHSVKLYDQLAQAPAVLAGSERKNLGLENMNTLLKTGKGENLLVYTEIEKDVAFPRRE